MRKKNWQFSLSPKLAFVAATLLALMAFQPALAQEAEKFPAPTKNTTHEDNVDRAMQKLLEPPQRLSTIEDNGDILKAFSYPVKHGPYRVVSQIGDGPHGSAGTGSGDHDFWRIPGLNAGWILAVDVTADDLPGGTLDPQITIWNAAGTAIAGNDDFVFCCDSYLEVTLPASGDYYVDVHDCCGDLTNPFNSSTGTGIFSEGPYELIISLHAVHP